MAEVKNRKRQRKKVVKYRRPISINIGFVIFAVIFAYIFIYMIMYFSRDRVSIYEVVYGKNADATNKTYTALLMRTENSVAADTSGYMNYYVRSGERAAVGTTIYTIDESGKIQEYLSSSEAGMELSDDDYETLRQYISSFTAEYSNLNFSDTYDFKIDLSSKLLECANMNAINEKLAELSADGGYNYSVNQAATAGIVEYYSDGYESKQISEITSSDFQTDKYSKKTVTSGELIAAGNQAYKIISEEEWNVLIPMSTDEADKYRGDTTMKIKFTEDGTSVTGDFQVVEQNGCVFGQVTLYKYMLKYADKRYAQIQIVETQQEGLKIPKSSVVTKDFFLVPKEFASVGGDSDDTGFYKQVYDEETNETSIRFIAPEIYYSDDDYYYIDDEDFAAGDIIRKNDSTDTFTIGQTNSLEGVYNVNSGYCIFRRIERVTEEEESGDYLIVNVNTSYGLKVYDHIVIDGSMVTENEVVFR